MNKIRSAIKLVRFTIIPFGLKILMAEIIKNKLNQS